MRCDLEAVVVTAGADEVARHPRCWARHQTLTDPAHRLAARVQAVFAAALADDDGGVEVRDLAAYDRALGVA